VLTVLNVAYPFAPVGPDAVGGAEQILSTIEQAVVQAGHCSLVVASEGSLTAGTLLPVPAPGEIDETVRKQVYAAVLDRISRALVDADIVHLHGIDFDSYLPPPDKPVLVTLHLPPSWYPEAALRTARPRTWFNCVSQDQQRRCPAGMRNVPLIPNGVPVRTLSSAHHARRRFALVLGRICPEKGQHLALQAAHAAGIPLLIGGEVFPYPEHRAYFEESIRPLLDSQRRYLGPVAFARKRRLLAAARCVLIPSLVPETSSLVAMEAAACGTPVIAFACGALPETVEHGRTGFLVDEVAAMANAIQRSADIDPALCREIAMRRFDAERMTDAYLALYAELAVWR
jgi:glycosyltransferase involved in cell wall biosynthesis